MPLVAGFHVGVVADFEKAEAVILRGDAELVVIKTRLGKRKITAPMLVRPVGVGMVQLCRGAEAINAFKNTLYQGGLHGYGNVDAEVAALPRYQCAEGVFELQVFAVK